MSRFVPPAGPPRVLALAQLANSLGDGAFYACSALFFTRVVGLSATQVGLALTLAWATGMLAGVPLGYVADRFGPRRTAVVLAVVTAGTLTGFLAVRSYLLFLLVACLYACCQGGLTSARGALLAGLVDAGERTRVRAHLQSTLNAGPRLAVLRDRPYAVITLLNAVMYLNMPLLSLGLPLWIVERTDAPKPMAAGLLIVNMLSVVLFQVRVAQRVTSLRTAARITGRAGWVLLAACGVYALSAGRIGAVATVAVLLTAAAVQVLGEMMQGAAAWELGFGLAPAGKQGQYQGFFSMGPQIARMLGPVLMTTLLIGWGTPGWLVLGGLFLAAGLAMAPALRWAERSRTQAAGTSTPALVTA